MIVIIGTGLAGYMLAKEFRKSDKETKLALITRGQGDFYSKPLLSTALTANKEANGLVISTAAQMAEQLDAKVYTETEVSAIDVGSKTLKFNGEALQFEKLVFACGAETVKIPLQGDGVAEMFSVNDLEDYARYRAWLSPEKKQVAILGSGLVGCEFANDLLNTGRQLDIISIDSYPLAKFIPEKIGRVLQQAFAEKGVRWHLGMGASAVHKVEDKFVVELTDGTQVQADGVLSAVGLRADAHLAKAAGLTVNQGIVVNRCLQTSHPDIYALGDCAEVEGEVKQYVAPLLQCARALAKVLSGNQDPVSYPSMPIVIKTPACPVVAIPPPEGIEGSWHYEGEGSHLSALFYDNEDCLRGFALIGEKVRDKMALAKQLPLVFA